MSDEKYLPEIEVKAAQETLPLAPPPPPPYVPAQEESKWKCKDCNGKPYKSRQSLKIHVEKFHPKASASTNSGAPVEPLSAPEAEAKQVPQQEAVSVPRRGWTRFLP